MDNEKLKCPYHDELAADVKEIKKEVKNMNEKMIKLDTSFVIFQKVVDTFITSVFNWKEFVRTEDGKLWDRYAILDEKIEKNKDEVNTEFEELRTEIHKYAWIIGGFVACASLFLFLIQVGIIKLVAK